MTRLNRRGFLSGSLAGLGAGLVAGVPGAAGTTDETAGEIAQQDGLLDRIAFDGPHQAGILEPAQSQATFAALDAMAGNRQQLIHALELLSAQARTLTTGTTSFVLPRDEPPTDSGTLGPVILPDGLTVTIAFGASLFDDRYGLAAARPVHLTRMPVFATDQIDPARAGGDVLIQICANHRDTVVHALREFLRTVRGSLQLRWMIDGFQSEKRGPTPRNNARNLFAFRDGTANPQTSDAELMKKLVWVNGGGEPAWTTGGTYQVVRAIRMHVEFWDRVGTFEQENMIGRVRTTGAPLGGTDEFENPRFDLDPRGDRIPLDAHIRLANPRTPETADQRILRRGYNYDRGFDEAGALDQGLFFSAFNQNPERQFARIQRRLVTEPMIDYITPVGGGYFFVPPGTGGSLGFIGESLFNA